MLIKWFASSFQLESRSSLNELDLNHLAHQCCTNLLSVGAIRQISSVTINNTTGNDNNVDKFDLETFYVSKHSFILTTESNKWANQKLYNLSVFLFFFYILMSHFSCFPNFTLDIIYSFVLFIHLLLIGFPTFICCLKTSQPN